MFGGDRGAASTYTEFVLIYTFLKIEAIQKPKLEGKNKGAGFVGGVV